MDTHTTLNRTSPANLAHVNGAGLLTVKQAAEYLGVSKGTLYVWRCKRTHVIPCVMLGGCVRYRREDLDAWLASRRVNPLAGARA